MQNQNHPTEDIGPLSDPNNSPEFFRRVESYKLASIDDIERIKKICTQVLPGWIHAEPKSLEHSDLSGLGGSKTYKIKATGCEPEAIIFHARKDNPYDPITEDRMESAQKALFARNLCPPR